MKAFRVKYTGHYFTRFTDVPSALAAMKETDRIAYEIQLYMNRPSVVSAIHVSPNLRVPQ